MRHHLVMHPCSSSFGTRALQQARPCCPRSSKRQKRSSELIKLI